jgi:hypothetical protein
MFYLSIESESRFHLIGKIPGARIVATSKSEIPGCNSDSGIRRNFEPGSCRLRPSGGLEGKLVQARRDGFRMLSVLKSKGKIRVEKTLDGHCVALPRYVGACTRIDHCSQADAD